MPFTKYTNLDFDQIKTSIKDYLRANSTFTDFDFEGSNFSVCRTLWVSSDGTALPAYIHAGALSSYKSHIDSRNRYYCNPEAANISFPI